MFIPVALGSISGGFLFGWLADKKLRTYLPAQVMFLVALASLLAGLADSIPTVVLYSFLLGTCYGGCSATNGALIPWLFGVVEVAAIAGTLSFVTVFSSSFGPFIFSLGDEVFGSYRSASIIFSIFPILLGIFVTIVKPHRISCLYKDSDGG